MDKQKHEVAIAALTDLIRSEVESADAAKFVRIARLCGLAQQLSREGAKRAKDFRRLDRGMGGGYIGGIRPAIYGDMDAEYEENGELQPIGEEMMPYPGGPLDQAGLFRNIMQMVGQMNSDKKGLQDQEARQSMAIELRELIHSKAELGDSNNDLKERLQTRIDELSRLIAAPQEKENNHADLVPAQPLRGHPSGFAPAQPDEGDDRGSLSAGEDSDGGPAEESEEGLPVVEAVAD